MLIIIIIFCLGSIDPEG